MHAAVRSNRNFSSINHGPVYLGPLLSRDCFGLPEDWQEIRAWLDPAVVPDMPEALPKRDLSRKCPEVAILQNYATPPAS